MTPSNSDTMNCMNIKNQIKNSLEEASGIENPEIVFSSNDQFGDYSSNIALRNKDLDTQKIADEINSKNLPFSAKVVGRFINFFIKTDVLVDNLMQIDGNFGRSTVLNGKKIMFEFAHPNTHKAFHIGHLRNITTGETLSRLYEAVGANVVRANYQGDVGLHIAKALYGIELDGFDDPNDIKKRAEFLGQVYAKGATAFEESDNAKARVNEINKLIYDKSDSKVNELYKKTRQWSLDYFSEIYKRVYTKFDRYYFESETFELGKETALKALKDGILKESEGAIIFEGSKHGLHDRVFISGKGVPTYEAKDLGLAKLQFKEYDPDMLVHTVGPEQIGYFQVIFKALELIFPPSKGKELHVPYGWVRLKEGKMSSRTGNVILGEKILDDAKENILTNYKNVDEKTAEMIAVGAVKYSFLKQGLGQDIAFDLKESISLEGNSGPYIQYTIARANSVLSKSKTIALQGSTLQYNGEELTILRSLVKFPEIIENSALNYSPNILCTYLYDLAQKFNSFYNKHKIIGSDQEEFRLKLTSGVGQVLTTGLNLLGINAPEKM